MDSRGFWSWRGQSVQGHLCCGEIALYFKAAKDTGLSWQKIYSTVTQIFKIYTEIFVLEFILEFINFSLRHLRLTFTRSEDCAA